jgi:hypothetical protein
MHPDEYIRAPKCKRCGRRGTLRVDKYRTAGKERRRPCNCYGYSFPHAKGRGWCDHNPKLTLEDLEQRSRYS